MKVTNHRKYLFTTTLSSGPVQQHIKNVYATLACALMVATMGTYLHMQYNLAGLLSSLMSFILLGPTLLGSSIQTKYVIIMRNIL